MRSLLPLLAPTLVACSSGARVQAPEPASGQLDRVLLREGGCVDSFMYGGSTDNKKLITIDLRDAPAMEACLGSGSLTRTYAWDDPDLELAYLEGRKLDINYCTDGISSGRRVDRTARPLSGTVTVTLTTRFDATTVEPYTNAHVVVDGVTWQWTRSGATFTLPEAVEFTPFLDIPFPVWDTAGAAVPCPGAP